MKCETAIDYLVDSLMDSLDDGKRAELDHHLESCNPCAAESRRLQSLWEGLGSLAAPAAGPESAVRFGRMAALEERRRFGPLLRVAATLALLMAGGAGGYWLRGAGTVDAAPETANSYLLLVRGTEPDANDTEADLVGEYMAWAGQLAGRGMLVDANKLTDEPGRWISGASRPDTRTESDVSGYFLIRAANYDEAVETALASPHIRYGGTFEIRQVDRAN